ncbi:MAG: LacI family DNA-binding transcriptional regulator [Actinomycetaceae bacterium]|nr:LacI family DNA-binding transcriptional regulator [Actinomycetaceae bacterium]
MPTVHDVAKRAGVSLATVSRTLNDPSIVRKETRERVLAAIEELEFVPAFNARALRKAKPCAIGIVMPQLSNPFFPSLIEAASAEAKKRDYSVLVQIDEEPFNACYQLAKSGSVEGIALVDQRYYGDRERKKIDLGIPVVAFDRLPSFTVEATYQVDNVQGARIVTEHLIDAGARKLLHISGLDGLDVTAKRLRGFYEGMSSMPGASGETLVLQGDFSPASGYKAVEKAIQAGFKLDAVFAANDLMAVGAIRALLHHNFSVPHHVLVAGFDGLDIGKYVLPSLTTLNQPLEEIATATVTHLLDAVTSDQEKPEPSLPFDSVVGINGDLIVRESSSR